MLGETELAGLAVRRVAQLGQGLVDGAVLLADPIDVPRLFAGGDVAAELDASPRTLEQRRELAELMTRDAVPVLSVMRDQCEALQIRLRLVADAVRAGVQVSVVVGGGNFFRGAELSSRGMDRARADYMGMLGTVMNALALQDFIEKAGVPARVQTAIAMGQVAESYIPLRAIRHMEKSRVVVFGAGAGLPYFSTDTVSAQRALETHCDELLVGKNGVDGVYTADPRKNPEAQRLDQLTYERALADSLQVVDASAFALCRDNGLAMRVFGMGEPGNITRALLGERIGTLVSCG